jgi:hypothetical protein
MTRSLTPCVFLVAVLLTCSAAWAQTSAPVDEYPLPPDVPAMIDVKRDCGAKGDGVADDTAALNKAMNEMAKGKYCLVYIPNGTYLVSGPVSYGAVRTFVHGQSRSKTIIKLKDSCDGFTDPRSPLPVLSTVDHGAVWNQRDKWRSGVIFRQSLYNVTIDIGKGNAGAVGLVYMNNNQGTVANVLIRSSDPAGAGLWGLGLVLQWPGPALIDDLAIEGFDYGVYSNQGQYSVTFKNLTLNNQLKAGFYNKSQVINIHRLTSKQTRSDVPAIQQDSGFITLVTADCSGKGKAAIARVKSGLYVRDMKTAGYESAIDSAGEKVPGPKVDEWCTGKPMNLHGPAGGSLRLPVEETPEVPWGPLEGWVSPRKFGAVGDGKMDDTAAIQKAIDSGAHTIYFGPKEGFLICDTIHVRKNVRRITGLGARFPTDKSMADKTLFRIEDGEAPVVVIERMNPGGAKVGIEQASGRTVVIRGYTGPPYANTAPGKVFIEDFCGTANTYGKGCQAWIWQLNTETEGNGRWNAINDGGTVWLFGQKTEKGFTAFTTRNGGKTEALGALHYAHGAIAQGLYVIEDGEMSIVSGGGPPPQSVIDTRGGQTKQLPKADFTGFYTTAKGK